MEKEISIELQKKINNYSYNAFYLCLLLNHKGYYPWFYERYIQLCLNPSKKIKFYNKSELLLDFYNGMAEPRSMLILEELDMDHCQNLEIISYLENMIKKGFIVFTYMDEYYINKNFQDSNEHFTHDILVYGFDNYKKIFKVMGFDEQLIFHKYELDYDLFQKAFDDGLKYSLENNLKDFYLIRMKLKYGNKYNYIFNLSFFLEQLNQYIFSINNSKLKPSYYKIYNDENNIYGYEIYKYIISHLNSNSDGNTLDYRLFHTLYEQKSGLLERFNYIMNNYEFSKKENYIKKMDEYTRIVKLFENIRLLVIKYNITKNRNIVGSIKKKLKDNYNKESGLLIDIYNLLNIVSINRIYNNDLKLKNKKFYFFKNLIAENFFILNDWADQDKGSSVLKFNDKLIINHRQHGKNELKLIFKNFCIDFYKDEIYKLSFNFKDDPDNKTKLINFILLSGWDEDKINLLQSIKIEEINNTIHMKFQTAFSGSAFIGLEFFWNYRSKKNCFYELSDFFMKGKFCLNKLKNSITYKNKSLNIKEKYKLKLNKNEWFITNDWQDQNKGSRIEFSDNNLILDHRIYGKNELWLVYDKNLIQIIKNNKYELLFNIEYFSDELKAVEIYFSTYFNEIKPLPVYSVSIKPKLKNKILFSSKFSCKVYLAFKFIWKNQVEENEKIIIGNLYIDNTT